ncbi:MAG: mechanosensitive ion channel [Rhodocyclaceae bacterium]|nr:MAG: mechanosensitive ion channel [Rhodocyclaceae bacterium]
MNREFNSLLYALRADMAQPDFWWQGLVLILCLALAWGLDRVYRRRTQAPQGGVKRMLFPVTALVLVFVSRALLRGWHPVNLLSIALSLLASLAVIRAVFYALRMSFSSTTWLAGFERIFATLVWSVVAMHIVGLLDPLISVMEDVSFTVGKQHLNLWLLVQGLVTVVVSLLVAFWLGGLAESRLARASELDGNLRLVFSRLLKSLLVLVAVLISLPLVGIDLTTLSVFGGALGVGLGFGLQKVASNYVSGFIILLDRSIRIGNVIAVGADRGEVTRITTRYTVLRSLSGVEAIVPNEVLMGSVVQNESLTDRRVRVALPVQVAYDTDLEKAMALLVAATQGQPRVLADPAPMALVTAFADSGINLEIGFWIADPEAGSGGLKSEINLAIWRCFKAEGISIPFPQREVRLLNSVPTSSPSA